MEQKDTKKDLRILMLEDTPSDAELAERELRKAGIAYVLKRVETRDAFARALEGFRPDIVLSDYKLPDFDGMTALQMVQRDHPEIPVIMFTGALSDIEAVDMIHAGAKDYVLKDRLARLGPAVQRALAAEQSARARKQAEQALRDSENRFRNLVETTSDLIWEVDVNAVYTYASPRIQDILGYEPAEVLGKTPFDLMLPEEAKRVASLFGSLATAQQPLINLENTCLHKDGHQVILETSGVPVIGRDGKFCGYRGIDRDITGRKQAEIALVRANRALATLSEVNRSLVYATDENELLQAICQAIVRQRGYRLAWVGYVQHDEAKTIRPMAQSGFEAGYLEALPLTWADNEYGKSPTGRAVRSGVTQISQNILLDPTYASWREQGLKLGISACIALPLRNGNGVFGNLSIYAVETDAFDQVEIALLEEMAGDTAFGVNALRIRHERDLAIEQDSQHIAQLQNSLEDTVRAIAGIVEMRDPYTAGHQIRVADLAAAIAGKMGLPDEQAHAIHLAGVVHDLGKIQIPSEILSKPGKISDIEFSLIQTHAQAGYDILKGISFPWPIAQMVLQHHERLDGSGYPQGLKGEGILLEARILAVADVVEAMYSHRPYRPGLGIEAALDEITRARGTRYDSQVVDACVALFREQGYSLGV